VNKLVRLAFEWCCRNSEITITVITFCVSDVPEHDLTFVPIYAYCLVLKWYFLAADFTCIHCWIITGWCL